MNYNKKNFLKSEIPQHTYWMATVKKTDCTKCQAACRGLVGM